MFTEQVNNCHKIPLPQITKGKLTLSQFYDLGDEIILSKVGNLIAKPSNFRPLSLCAHQAESIQITQPPIQIELGNYELTLAQRNFQGTLRSSIYDLGAIAITIEVPLFEGISWPTVALLMASLQTSPPDLEKIFSETIAELKTLLQPSIIHPSHSSLVEDYTCLVVESFDSSVEISTLAEDPRIWAALLGEQVPLSAYGAKMFTPISYYPDDLALLSWNGAILIEPNPLAAATALELIEFANIELLLMRSYDEDLSAQLPRMYSQLPKEQPRFAIPLVRRYSQLLHAVHRLIVDFTEVTEKVDNAIKVTDDVYWNRFYTAILNVLKVDVWRSGVEHKLNLLRETYSMLHDEADAERATALEWTIVILILLEIIMALLK